MSEITSEASFERCADELNDFVGTLEGYSHTILAFALRVQLSAMLQALMSQDVWSQAEVAAFLQDLTNETLEQDES